MLLRLDSFSGVGDFLTADNPCLGRVSGSHSSICCLGQDVLVRVGLLEHGCCYPCDNSLGAFKSLTGSIPLLSVVYFDVFIETASLREFFT